MLIRPIQTEKAYTEQTKNTYVFLIPGSASKQSVKAAVETEYKVSVISIRVLRRKGKATKFSRGKRAYPGTTFRKDRHYAYVTLKAGDKIKVFDEEATEDTKATEQAKTTIKTTDAKQSEKATKTGLFARKRTGRRGDK